MSFSDLIRNSPTPTALSYEQVRPILRWVYAWMGFGLLVTTLVSLATVSSNTVFTLRANPALVFGAFIAEIALVIGLGIGLRRSMSPTLAAGLFVAYAALNGFTLSLIFLYFRAGSIVAAFGTTTLLFGTMSVIGFTTNIDMTKWGTYLMIGLIGLVIAMVVNLFLHSGPLELVISMAGVVIFTILTAYDTQKIKRIAANPAVQADASLAARMSIFGALQLYLDFVNLFLFLLRLMGGRR